MATFDTPLATWTIAEVQHFARRAGFGLSPEAALELAQLPPATVIDGWVDGTLASIVGEQSTFQTALARADVVSSAASGAIPADPAPHPFRLEPWRSGWTNLQSDFAWRMQFNPWSFQEKLALFWHQLLATGAEKVNNPALMQKHVNLLRSALARGPYGALLLAVSQDPAMMTWLDTIQNRVRPGSTDVANENYAREILELYSLGVDNGYSQADITNLARAFSGWTYTPLNLQADPNSPTSLKPADGSFLLRTTYHATGTVSFLGQTFDLGASSHHGEDLVGAIFALRGPQAAEFLAKRLLRFFATPAFDSTALRDFQALVQALNFDVGRILKALFKSAWFHAPAQRHALYEAPVAWIVRAARMLGPRLAVASAQAPLPGYPAWRLVTPYFQEAGQDVLNPEGPNGWAEHEGWINAATLRYRGSLAAALALNEKSGTQSLFPTDVPSWFPAPPGSARAVYDRLEALLQPAPIPAPVRDTWLASLWPAAFTWDATSQTKARELAYLLLTSPWGQLH